MEGKSIKTFRFDLGLSWNARSVRARLWIEAFSPDWISLQFVCFGFNSKGFVHDLVKPLSRICEGYRIHWMFHELWVGIDADARLKLRVWGWFQSSVSINTDRKSTRLNSSHQIISYAVFCLKKK